MRRLIAYPFSVEILVPQIEEKINPKDDILQITYGPDISREFLFATDVEYPEWSLREGKRLKGKLWAKQFVTALTKTADEIKDDLLEEDVIESEINIDDLPTIIWNDTEYSVLFNDDGTAEVINEFGNTVITLEGASTINQVNDQLSDQEVVVDEDISNETSEIEQEDELVVESNKILKRLVKASNEVKDILNKAQQFAYIPEFKNEFDANLIEFEHMIENIKASENKINIDNELDRTQRSDIYYLNEEDTDTFKETICPMCEDSNFNIIDKNDNEWTIQCNECGTTYVVNLKTGQVGVID